MDHLGGIPGDYGGIVLVKTTITLDSKEVRTIISRFLGIPEERVIPMRYSFAVEGMTEAEIAGKLEDDDEHE